MPERPSPESLRIEEFTYPLPEERIAKFPLKQRDQSRLLLYHEGKINDHRFFELPDLLQPGDLLVFNNTRVIHARLHFQRESGAQIEILCLEPEDFDYHNAFTTPGKSTWTCLVGNAKKWKGEPLHLSFEWQGQKCQLSASLIVRNGMEASVSFSWDRPELPFDEVLRMAGELPIPPYLNRDTSTEDQVTYQTIYASIKGSVAAPTAGLHFTPELLQKLKDKGIEKAELTLHVGAGTFLPVKSETMAGHEMHRETILAERSQLEIILRALVDNRRIIAVGTTSMRSLESFFWFGNRTSLELDRHTTLTNQWEPYQTLPSKNAKQAIENILRKMEDADSLLLEGQTQLLIAPGYQPHLIHGLITNFHQPGSTLLLLVAAVSNNNWETIYEHALQNQYRFLSFGDSSLLWCNHQ